MDPTASAPRVFDKARREPTSISADRYKQFKKALRRAFDNIGITDDMVELDKIVAEIQLNAGNLPFSEGELSAGFEKMEADNMCMVADDKITLI